jgi:hypothetical protein
MTDVSPTGPAVEARLRDFLAAELRQAELDFPHLPRRNAQERRVERRGLVPLVLATAGLAVLAMVVIGPRFINRGTVGTGAIELGADGLPLAIGGEPVARGDEIAGRLPSGSFLAGGTLVLDTGMCLSRSARAQLGCPEGWTLVAGPIENPSSVFTLDGAPAAPGFVRTSGAPTVARVHGHVAASGAVSSEILVVESIVWREPTKGPIPDNASPPEGGAVNDALVPDFVRAWAGDGVTVAGYVPKRFLLGGGTLPGSPSAPPQPEPAPVYADDLTTLVGHMVPGIGFVALGASAPPALPSPSVAPSAAPSPRPSPTPSTTGGVLVDCGRISPEACATVIDLVRAGHEAEVTTATRIVMDDTCAPTVACDRKYPFDSIVVFVTAGGDTTGWYAFSVVGLVDNTPTTVKPWIGDIPDHVLRALTEASPSR